MTFETPLPVSVTVSPEPTDDELAAILAAYRELWPPPPPPTERGVDSTRWRFSGRWWHHTPRRPVAGGTWR